MIKLFISLSPSVQAAIVSAVTSILVLVLGTILKAQFDKHSLRYRMGFEYVFDQRRRIKEEIAKTKTPLLNAAEYMNYRLWNMQAHLDENWLAIPEEKWLEDEHHYIRSFVYRWLRLIHCAMCAEDSVSKIDATLSSKDDLVYLKFVKSIRFCLTDRLLLASLGYKSTDTRSHFYVDRLPDYALAVAAEGHPLTLGQFEKSLKGDLAGCRDVFLFFSHVRKEPSNPELNQLRALHLLLMEFLNRFGHEYQHTSPKKLDRLLSEEYAGFAVAHDFSEYIKRHKLSREMRHILERVNANTSPRLYRFLPRIFRRRK